MGKGPGPCVGAVTREEYADNVAHVVAFLEGRHRGVADDLERGMHEAAADLDFERAARLRNSLEAVRKVLERQKVVSSRPLDADVFGIVREETIAGVHAFVVREGRVLIGNEFVLDKGLDVPLPELVEGLLLRYYGADTAVPPKEVLVPALPPEPDAVEEWLASVRAGRVRLHVPERGEKARLLDLAVANAHQTLGRFKARTMYEDERANKALLELTEALSLPRPPLRIECYDISTLHGRHSVGSMVAFTAGRPDPKGYRHFRIRLRTETGESDDVAMMAEVLRRRFAAPRAGDSRFAKPPDLVMVDGGKPQLGAALKALAEAGAEGVPLAALAKREEELYLPARAEPVSLPAGSPALYLVKRIRDEAHRFAVTYHRDIRGRAMTASVLDDIPGLGPKRRKALLKAFGSVKRIREATIEEIAAVPGVPRAVAEEVASALGTAATAPAGELGDRGA